MKKLKISWNKGFSLVELAIIITILTASLVNIVTNTVAPGSNDLPKYIETKRRMTVIHDAMLEFRKKFNRLPCPGAAPKVQNTLISFPNNFVNSVYIYQKVYFGSEINGIAYNPQFECMNVGYSQYGVPTLSLGIPPQYMFDAWGNYFLYAPSTNLCSSTSCSAAQYLNNDGGITVSTASAGGGTVFTTTAAYVLLSPGPNRYGGQANSNTLATSASITTYFPIPAANTGETENTNKDAFFVRNYPSSTFDDIVDYRTKLQLDNINKTYTVNLLSQSFCAYNSSGIYGFGQDNSSTYIIPTIRSTMTMTQSCDGGTVPSCAGGTYYNYADEALLDIMWSIQDACYEMYGSSGSLTRSCSSPGTNYTNANACCPLSGIYDTTTNSCYCRYNTWKSAVSGC